MPVDPDTQGRIPSIPLPDPKTLARQQIDAARKLLTRDITGAPRWPWPRLDALVGPMLPPDLIVLGGLMGNGKSSLLMSLMDALAIQRIPVLYFPLEIDPQICRLHWVAWKFGLDRTKVVRQQWDLLPKHSQRLIDEALQDQDANPYIHFASPKRLAGPMLRRWLEWGVKNCGAKLVIIDHFHRLVFGEPGGGRLIRVDATEMARQLRDAARSLDVPIVAAAQLNRDGSVADAYLPPGSHRLKETSALGEEADVILMVSRTLKRGLPARWESMLRTRTLKEHEIGIPNRMTVMCRKHRLDGSAFNHDVELHVAPNGHVRSLPEDDRQE